MNMNFFKQLAEHLDGYDLNITIRKKDGELTVSVTPKIIQKSKTKLTIRSLNLVGTPKELDEGFIKEISAPLQKTTGLATNVAEYEKDLDAQGDKAKKNAGGKGVTKKTPPPKGGSKPEPLKSGDNPPPPKGNDKKEVKSDASAKSDAPTGSKNPADGGGQIGMFK